MQRNKCCVAAGAPPPEVLEAVAAGESYFVGEPVDISALTLDLSAHDAVLQTDLRGGAAGAGSVSTRIGKL